MKNIFKSKLAVVGALLLLGGSLWSASNIYTDFWSITGREGTGLQNTSIAFIDAARDLNLYDGDLVLGLAGATPSKTAGAYPGFQVQFYNASGGTMSEGDVVISSIPTAGASTNGYASKASVLSTSTVLGVCAGTVANGAIGWMRVDGWAIVNTTGTVNVGDLLVTTNTAVGYAGAITSSTGTIAANALGIIGRAMAAGTATGGTTLVLMR